MNKADETILRLAIRDHVEVAFDAASTLLFGVPTQISPSQLFVHLRGTPPRRGGRYALPATAIPLSTISRVRLVGPRREAA